MDSGRCLNCGVPLPPFRRETFLSEDGQPVIVWVAECSAMRPVETLSISLIPCGGRVYAELAAVGGAAWITRH
jgi:hypothetical protein